MIVIGFRMMLGDWANELDPKELLELYTTKLGVGSVKDGGILSDSEDELPINRMTDYDPKTTIMTFKFDEGYEENELPKYFIKGCVGVITGESNCELIYEEK
jgi:hypothetical protein